MQKIQPIFLIIAIATLVRCCVALTIGLGNDEVYYITYAQHLQWNYFDHPPMVGLLIKLSTLNLNLTNDFFIRLGAIFFGAINTFLVYKICCFIKNKKAGIVAALLYSGSLYSSIIAGLFILPDSPQLFFWLLSVFFVLKIVSNQDFSKQQNLNLLFFGLYSGLCIMSKVHGVFLWFGFGMFVLFYKQSLLKNPFLYLSFLTTLLVISPILIWNIDNNFITYNFHSQRVAIDNSINFSSFLREFVGGIFYNNPINFFLIVMTLIAVFKNKIELNVDIKRIVLWLSLPLILVLLFVSFFRETLPHWSGPAYTTLILIAACFIADEIENRKITRINWSKLVSASWILTATICVLAPILINFYPNTLGKKDDINLGKFDFTLDMYNWNFFQNEFEKIRNNDVQNHKTKTTFIVNNKWFPASHVDHYISQPLALNFVAIGKLEDIHTYAWLNNHRKKMKIGDDAYFITFSNSFTNPNEIYSSNFKKIQPPVEVYQYRSKVAVRKMLVYLMQDYKP